MRPLFIHCLTIWFSLSLSQCVPPSQCSWQEDAVMRVSCPSSFPVLVPPPSAPLVSTRSALSPPAPSLGKTVLEARGAAARGPGRASGWQRLRTTPRSTRQHSRGATDTRRSLSSNFYSGEGKKIPQLPAEFVLFFFVLPFILSTRFHESSRPRSR